MNTILLLHPCELLRAGIRAVLEPLGMKIVEATDTVDAVEIARSLHPKIALLDAGPSFAESLYLTELLCRERCRIMVFVPYDEELFLEYKQHGAVAYANPAIGSAELVALVERIRLRPAGVPQISLLPSPVKPVQEVQSPPEPLSDPGPLTPTERAVLKHIMGGFNNKQTSIAIGCCELTIKNHITAIMRKLNAYNRTHAVVIGLNRGIISLEDSTTHPLVLSPEAFATRKRKWERRAVS